MALGHEHRAGVATFSVDKNSKACGSGDGGHYAEIDSVLFEERALFDVEFDERRVIALLQRHGVERAVEACGLANFIERLSAGVFEVRVEGSAQKAAAETSDSEARGFF